MSNQAGVVVDYVSCSGQYFDLKDDPAKWEIVIVYAVNLVIVACI